MTRMLAACLLAAVGAAFVPSVHAQEAVDTSAIHVKKAIADRMTPEQLQAYKERMARTVATRRSIFRPGPMIPADTCPAATNEVSALPYSASDTTVGMTDDYDLPPDITDPTCTAPATCTGTGPAGSLPRGAIYTGTGMGPDRAYKIRTDANCNLTLTMTPPSQDLALILYQAACSSSLADCACVSDTGVAGQTETIQLSAVAGVDYFIVVDGYSTSAVPPGPSGPFSLSVNGTGCNLVGDFATLSVATVGPGTVTSAPAGINCPGDCSEDYVTGTPVTLTATAGADAVFAGWSGACTNTTGDCSLTMNANESVTATFVKGLYTAVTPCRLLDTRLAVGPLGGPPLVAGASRTFQVAGNCGIPATATAVAFNVAAVGSTAQGNLRIYETGIATPTIASINYAAGQTRSNNVISRLDGSGQFDIFAGQASGTVNAVVDVVGYFVE